MLGGTLAVAGLTWREAWRYRLWLVPVLAAAVVWAFVGHAATAEAGDATRLLTAIASAAAGFCGLLLAALVPAQQLTRDIEQRIVLTAFPKPLPRLGWLLGRWLGSLLIAGACMALVALAGAAAVSWRAGGIPTLRAAVPASAVFRLTALGEAVPLPHGVVRLAGPAGDGVRWTFSGLDPAADDYEILVQAQVSSLDADIVESVPVQVAVLLPDGRQQPLLLDPRSPYGRPPPDASMPNANAWLANRSSERRSLANDWARFALPPGSIDRQGQLTVQLTRLDPRSLLQLGREQAVLARPAGPLPLHALRAVLAELATPAVIAAAALAVGAIAGLPVAALAAFTLAFAGHALWTVHEVLSWNEMSRPLTRLLDLLVRLVPDFAVTGQGTRLASGEAVGWAEVGRAWAAVLPHLAALLLLGWWMLARRQV
ncbi:MAG: hypothetical protein RMM29_00570 [Planctomycetota bacterium]|nr:hypothetical protein [Planctomycetota bacterium]MCX8039387.1 hypothetical protein [Planctomycetota bacterium]MDW8372128.1 hypothetical protein [Planctomycetota bacterium]